MKALDRYFKEIEPTNRKIGSTLSWKEYAKKFKKVNPDLHKALIEMTNYEVRLIKDEYLRNWIKNLRSKNE